MLFCGFVDKDLVFNVIYRDEALNFPIKRCRIEQFIHKGYSIVPENCTVLKLTTDSEAIVYLNTNQSPDSRSSRTFIIKDYLVKV